MCKRNQQHAAPNWKNRPVDSIDDLCAAPKHKHARISGLIYFLKAGTFVKIGHTTKPRMRINEIQVSCPYLIEPVGFCEGGRKEEKSFHWMAVYYQIRGEWFRYDGELRRWLEGASNVVTMQWGKGFTDYCFQIEVGNRREFMVKSLPPEEMPVLGPGPRLFKTYEELEPAPVPLNHTPMMMRTA